MPENKQSHKGYKKPMGYRKTKRANELKIHIEIIRKILKDREDRREIMNSQGIMGSLNSCIQALNKGNTELKILGVKKAQAERVYRIKQAEEILKLKEEKHPVTLIMELVKGNKDVAELRSQRDIAESDYQNCISAIDNLRIEIDAIKSKLNWLKVQLENW